MVSESPARLAVYGSICDQRVAPESHATSSNVWNRRRSVASPRLPARTTSAVSDGCVPPPHRAISRHRWTMGTPSTTYHASAAEITTR